MKQAILRHPYFFTIGEIVSVKGVECVVLELGYEDGKNDYLCAPIDRSVKVYGQWEYCPGWVFEQHLERVSK